MNNKKLFAFCCGTFLYGALFSSQVPKNVDLNVLEQKAIVNAFNKMTQQEYNAFFLSQPSDIRNRCIQFPDRSCVDLFLKNRSNCRLNQEKK